MHSGARTLNPRKPLCQRHGFVFAENSAVFHHVAVFSVSCLAARLEQEVLAEAAGRRSKFVELSLDLQALQLIFIVDLGEVGALVIRVASGVRHRKHHVLAEERQSFLLGARGGLVVCAGGTLRSRVDVVALFARLILLLLEFVLLQAELTIDSLGLLAAGSVPSSVLPRCLALVARGSLAACRHILLNSLRLRVQLRKEIR